MTLAGVILAGGKSSRMGTPKEGVQLHDGRAMIEHVAEALNPLVETIIVSGDCAGFNPARIGAIRVADRHRELGPLAGIEAVLASRLADQYLFVACDQPLLRTALLRQLLPLSDQPVVFRSANGREYLPFPCIIPGKLVGEATQALLGGERSPRRWLANQSKAWRLLPAEFDHAIESFNTAASLGRLTNPHTRR